MQAYYQQAEALLEGGVDLFIVETIIDTLNAKAAIFALEELFADKNIRIPVMLSGTIVDESGRTLSGQTDEAFWNSVSHAKPFAVGLNGPLGAEDMHQYISNLSKCADCYVFCYPTAGVLPARKDNFLYCVHSASHTACTSDPCLLWQLYRRCIQITIAAIQTFSLFMTKERTCEGGEVGADLAAEVKPYLSDRLVNAIGGCSGTSPARIAAMKKLVADGRYKPRQRHGMLPCHRRNWKGTIRREPYTDDAVLCTAGFQLTNIRKCVHRSKHSVCQCMG